VSRPRGCHRGASFSPYPGLNAGSGVARRGGCAESRFGERMWRNRANLSQNALSPKPQTPWPFSTPGCAKQAVACAFQGATSHTPLTRQRHQMFHVQAKEFTIWRGRCVPLTTVRLPWRSRQSAYHFPYFFLIETSWRPRCWQALFSGGLQILGVRL